MTLFLTLLPLYLVGNFHCAAMCGPLVALLGKRRYRHHYFVGRTLAFSLAGLVAAEIGLIVNVSLRACYIPAITSLLFGFILLMLGFFQLFRIAYPGQKGLARWVAPLSAKLGALLSEDRPFPIFLFGLCTILLPCGQTVVVFSTCALFADPLAGLVNGFLFALFTSPSLIAAMGAVRFVKKDFARLGGILTLLVGSLALCRGLAEIEVIPHVSKWHLILY